MQKLILVLMFATLSALVLAVALPTGQAATKAAPAAAPPAAAPATPTAAPPATRPGWTLVWSDEFDTPGLVNEKKWRYEEGMLRNNEAQYYMKARKENCRVEGGMLIIEAIKEKGPGGRGDFTSASIETRGLASWTYGRIEARAKIPQGRGTWPAFWTLGNQGGWPGCGEIDIMEFVGFDPDKIHYTIHWNAGGHKQKGGTIATKAPYNDFHVYAVEWYPDRIDAYFDDTKYSSVDLSTTNDGANNAFKKPHYIKLNFAVGGGWGGQKGIDDSIWPQKYIVDYVRVYQKPGAGS